MTAAKNVDTGCEFGVVGRTADRCIVVRSTACDETGYDRIVNLEYRRLDGTGYGFIISVVVFEEYGVKEVGATLKAAEAETRISQFGCTEESLEELTAGIVEVSFSADGTLASIPPITRDEAYEIYKLAL